MHKNNLPTLLSIAAISWILVNISHETIGHAGFGLLSGFKLNAVNTTTAYLDVNWDKEINLNGITKYRLFLIGGGDLVGIIRTDCHCVLHINTWSRNRFI